MSNVNIFQNSSKSVPESDEQIVRIDMTKSDIGGRKSHLPSAMKADKMTLSHVPNASTSPGNK
ncbi:MAG: hypothetical protein KGL39_17285 [Patescibacteria group bacterium]|nr:hypothetical protein [Patescibacteria group bacterium]